MSSPPIQSGPGTNPLTVCREQLWLAIDDHSDFDDYVTLRNVRKYKYRDTDTFPGEWTFDLTPGLVLLPGGMGPQRPQAPRLRTANVSILVEGAICSDDWLELTFFWWLVISAVMDKYKNSDGDLGHANIRRILFTNPRFRIEDPRQSLLVFTEEVLFEYLEVLT